MPEDNKLEIYNQVQDETWFKKSSIGLGVAGSIVNIVIVSLGLIAFIGTAIFISWVDQTLADFSVEWSSTSYNMISSLRSSLTIYIILGFVALAVSIATLVLIKRKSKGKVLIGGIFEIVWSIVIFALVILNLILSIFTGSIIVFLIILILFAPLIVAGALKLSSGIKICLEYKSLNGGNKNSEPQY